MPYKAIIFDYDGTIVDTERVVYACWREVFREHRQDLPLSEWAEVVGAASDAVDPFEMLESKLGRAVDREALDEFRRRMQEEMLAREPLRPGIENLVLEGKRRGVRLGVASNSPEIWVRRGLLSFNIADHFEAVCTPDDGVSPKPSPALYLLAAERLGVPPAQAIAIEDSPHGAAAALAAGLVCVVVPGELTQEHTFPPGCIRLQSLEGIGVDRLIELVRESVHTQPSAKE